ncbi:hypothetical protein [Sinosporangium siamense]|uniref:Uncharacterized protein n=1 Tax=Sinosporangium siamense TaxID=1367973 RepID=A0A919RAC2_9ACTN|nr:hypothetical protein [Sinosporangium siamense]GII90253.1 hypothetical protein Ssi02_04840 [Sinosporangium siamense]
MALTQLYRDASLRQRISKTYVILGRQAAQIAERLATSPPPLPLVEGRPCTLLTDKNLPGAVWIDTGPVWLFGPAVRARVASALGTAVSRLAKRVAELGGTLVPAAYVAEEEQPKGWLSPDLHAVEVLTDMQRELVTNLLRQHSPSLIALSGRAAHGPRGVDPQGSRRLADSSNQLTTRYITSFSQAHLSRVQENLRRFEGVSDLALMDVNPLGDSRTGLRNVSVSLFDGQTLIGTTMAHAILLQAISMRARAMERMGRRVGAIPHRIVDLNRSRAIASGLSATFLVEAGDGRPGGKAGRSPGERQAGGEALKLFTQLIPEFRALDVHYAELSPLLSGLVGYGSRRPAVRGENDLMLVWRRKTSHRLEPKEMGRLLSDPAWLTTDHVSAANHQAAPGPTALVAAEWTARLAGEKPTQDRPPKKDSSSPRKTADPATELFNALEKAAADREPAPSELAALLDGYFSRGGDYNLNRAMQKLDGERAKTLRRILRPNRESTVRAAVAAPWDRLFGIARKRQIALLVSDVPAADADAAQSSIQEGRRSCPGDLRFLLLSSARYRGDGGGRATCEILIVQREGRQE